jgi:hypothetical protein
MLWRLVCWKLEIVLFEYQVQTAQYTKHERTLGISPANYGS